MLKQVIKKVDKGVLGTVTGTFKKMSFHVPKSYDSSNELIAMNIPHWLARRNAAYQTALDVISIVSDLETPGERRENYFRLIKLIELALHANNRYLFGLVKQKKQKIEDPFNAYLEVLYNITKALCALMDASVILNSPKHHDIDTGTSTTVHATTATRVMDNVCLKTEVALRLELKNLVDSFKNKLDKERNSELKQLVKLERQRYQDSMSIILEDLQHHDLITLQIKHKT